MKILVINTKFLGDLVISTPGLRSLRRQYPNAEIVFLLRKGFEEVFDSNTNLNRIISFDPDLKGNTSFKKFIKGIEFIRDIREEKFDTIIALHPGDRIAFWSWFSKAGKRIAPKKQSFGFLFNVLVDVNEDSISYLEYYNKIFQSAGVILDSNKTEYFISKIAEQWANKFVEENIVENDTTIIGIHPGASEPTKIWKEECFHLLIESLIKLKNYFIILFEGPNDEEIIFNLKNKIRHKNIAYVKTGISNVASLIKKCRLFITHDTGTRHLAVAVGTPTITLIPLENKKYWDFYTEAQKHYSIIGRRNISHKDVKPFLDGITVELVYNKIISILQNE